MKTQAVAVSLAMAVLVMATSVVSNNKLTFAAAGKPNDIAGKVEILELAGVLRAVASGTIEIYDDAGKRAYRFDRSIHPGRLLPPVSDTCYYIPPGGNMALTETPFQDLARPPVIFHF